MELVFVTANNHKAAEVQKVVNSRIKILSLKDINCFDDIEETGNTFHENALIKTRHVFNKFRLNCFADDSGLEVEALNGAPGVFSARYSGEPKNDANNIVKLLQNLKNHSNRNACFKTVIALVINGEEFTFEGKINGTISTEILGKNGFGYDPVFIPQGYTTTFAQMTSEEKNSISHRALAVQKLNAFLNSYV